jgi:4-hydroxy-3-methylbut-2-enyl diphosphate reductase
MEIIVGKTSGFCHGVKNAVDKATEEINQSDEKVYCLGELVHNKHVTNNLQQKGLKFIENMEEAKGKTIIRAHGVTKETYQKAQKLKIELKDLTCPKVLKIHDIAEEYSKNGYYIFLVGIANHPETIGTFSFCGNNSSIIENISDLEQVVTKFEETNIKKALLITQTTFNLRKFEEISERLKKMLENVELKVINTICLSTELRQKETEELSQNVDLMLIIGGRNSSNTNKLYDISSKYCKNVIFAESLEDINIESIKQFEKIGVMAGASTPRQSIDSIVNFIKQEAGEKLCVKK